MLTKKVTYYIAGVLLLAGLLPLVDVRADLEVGPPPPGQPLDWVRKSRHSNTENPRYVLSEVKPLKEEEPKEKKPDDGLTKAKVIGIKRYAEAPANVRTIAFDPFSKYNTASADMAGHITWINTPESFKPKLSFPFRWMLVIMAVRAMIHPEICSEAQIVEYLIEIGQPALFWVDMMRAAGDTGGYGSLEMPKRIAAAIEKAIGPPAGPPPPAKIGTTPFETMVNRLIAEELGKDYYYATNFNFAKRLRLLGESIAPYIIDAAKNCPHNLIRHNAVALLENYNKPEVLETLREIVKGRDAVARNRALSALIKKRDAEIIPFLVSALKGPDKYFRVYATYGLGGLGTKDAVKPLCDYIAANSNDRDVLEAALPALARLGQPTQEVRSFIEQGIKGNRAIIRSIARLALAALGDKESINELAFDPAERRPLRKIESLHHYLAIEVLGRINGKFLDTNKMLLSLAQAKELDIQLRFHALRYANFTKADKEIVIGLIRDNKLPPILRAYAVYSLFSLDEKASVEQADFILQEFLNDPRRLKERGDGGGFEAVIAMRLLGLLNQNKDATLLKILDKVLQEPPIKEPKAGEVNLSTPAPVPETTILELGTLKSEKARDYFIALLSTPEKSYRAEAAMALGQMSPTKEVVKTLLHALRDQDGWVRYCSYWALKQLTRQEFTCEWVFDSEPDREPVVRQWETWWKETGSAQLK